MERKTDVRSKIFDEYRTMVCSMPMGKITVSGLCERVGISRKTFYTYFESRDDLLAAIIRDDVVEPIKRLYPLFGSGNEAVSMPLLNKLLYQSLYEHKDFYLRVVTQNEERIFVHAINRGLIESHEFVRSVTCDKPMDAEFEYASSFLTGAQSSLVVKWIRGGMTVSPEQLGAWFDAWGVAAVRAMAGVQGVAHS